MPTWRQTIGEVLKLALPMMVSTLSWTIMQFIDRVFLFGYSQDSMAAALPAGALFFWMICLPLGVASYANTFVAQYFGAQRHGRIGLVVWQAVFVGLATVPLCLLTIPLAPAMFAAIDHGAAIAELETTYFQISTACGGAMVLAGGLSSFFTGRGQMRTVMIVDCLGAALNVLLDYCWIFGYAGFPEAGIAGAAWATVVAMWIKVAVYFALFLRAKDRDEFGTTSGLRFDRALMARLLRFGTPNGVQMFLEVGGFTLFLLLVGQLGKTELTASSLAFNVNMLAFMPVWGICIATTTLVGQHLGENRPALAERSTWAAYWLAAMYMTLMGAVYVFAPQLILQVYRQPDVDVAQVHHLAVVLLRFVAAYSLFDAMNMVFSSALKGAGDTRFIMLMNLALVPLPAGLSWLGIELAGWGLYWAWFALTIWVIVLGLAFLWRFLRGPWRGMRVIETGSEDFSAP